MRYRFITAEKALYPVTLLCRLCRYRVVVTMPGAGERRAVGPRPIGFCWRRYVAFINKRSNGMVVPGCIKRCWPKGCGLVCIGWRV